MPNVLAQLAAVRAELASCKAKLSRHCDSCERMIEPDELQYCNQCGLATASGKFVRQGSLQ